MAKESIAITCFNWEVGDKIRLYGGFGWEVVSNNVVTSLSSDAGNIAAMNEITFNRDKDAPWYNSVNPLYQEYLQIDKKIEEIENTEPPEIGKFSWLLFIVLFMIFLIGLVYRLIYVIMREKNIAERKKWHNEHDPEIADLRNQQKRLSEESREIINGAD